MKTNFKTLVTSLCALVLLAFSVNAHAEQKVSYKEYDIHYIVLNTKTISPEIARQYDLTRSGKRAFINISLLDTRKDDIGTPVLANVEGHFLNMIGQRIDLDFREIEEGSGIYYIDDFGIDNKETLRFILSVQPKDREDIKPFTVKFSQQTWFE
jgi:hypothetical protein